MAHIRSALDLPIPGTRQAPKEFTGRWEDALPFLDLYNRICAANNVTDPEKCTSLLQYCSYSTRKVIEGMEAYQDRDWPALQSEIEKQYNAKYGDYRFVEQDLSDLAQKWRHKSIHNLYDFRKYTRQFTAIAGWLKGKNKITEKEYNLQFWAGLPKPTRELAEARITTVEPRISRSSPYPVQKVVEACEYIMDRDHFDARPIARARLYDSDSESDSEPSSESEESDSEDDDVYTSAATRGRKSRKAAHKKKSRKREHSPPRRKRSFQKPVAAARDHSPVSKEEARKILRDLKDEEDEARRQNELDGIVQRMSTLKLTDHEYNTLYLMATSRKPALAQILMEPLTRTSQHRELGRSMMAANVQDLPSRPPIPVPYAEHVQQNSQRDLQNERVPQSGYTPNARRDQPRAPRDSFKRMNNEQAIAYQNEPNNRSRPMSDRGCFGCGKEGHMMGDCPALIKLLNDRVIERNQNGGRLIMADGRRIFREPGEKLLDAINRLNRPQSNFITFNDNAPIVPPTPSPALVVHSMITEYESDEGSSSEDSRSPHDLRNRAAVYIVPGPATRKRRTDADERSTRPKRPKAVPSKQRKTKLADVEPVEFALPVHNPEKDDAIMEDDTPQPPPVSLKQTRAPAKSNIARQQNPDGLYKKFMATPVLVSVEDLLAGNKDIADRVQLDLKKSRPEPAIVHEILARSMDIPRARQDAKSRYDPLIRIWVECGGYRIEAIIDTGSQMNILNKEIWDKHIPLARELLEEAEMLDAGGNVNKLSEGICRKVPLQFASAVTLADLYLKNNVPFHLLLGRPWQRRNRVSIEERADGTYLVLRDRNDVAFLEKKVAPGDFMERDVIYSYYIGAGPSAPSSSTLPNGTSDSEPPSPPQEPAGEVPLISNHASGSEQPGNDSPSAADVSEAVEDRALNVEILPHVPEQPSDDVVHSSNNAPTDSRSDPHSDLQDAADLESDIEMNSPAPLALSVNARSLPQTRNVFNPEDLGLAYPTLPRYHYWGTLLVSFGDLTLTALINIVEPRSYMNSRVWLRTGAVLDRTYQHSGAPLIFPYAGFAQNVPLSLRNRRFEADVLVSDEIPIDLLLGKDWLRKHRLRYNLTQQCIKLRLMPSFTIRLGFDTHPLNAVCAGPITDADFFLRRRLSLHPLSRLLQLVLRRMRTTLRTRLLLYL